MKLGVSANITDLKRSALTAQFDVATDVSSFDGSALGNYRGLALNLAGRNGTTARAENGVRVSIRDIDVPSHCNQVEIDVSGSENSPSDGPPNLSRIRSAAGKFDSIFAAALLNLDEVVIYLKVDRGIPSGRVDLQVTCWRSNDYCRAFRNRAFCENSDTRGG
jgi:hypothetical protein